MAELKRCPFCGGEATVRTFYKGFCVCCTKCKASTLRYSPREEMATEAWNKRYTPSSEIDFDYSAEDD